MRILRVCPVILLCAVVPASADEARDILQATGVQGGLIVHLGCGDGRMTAAFAKGGYIVQGLGTDKQQVSSARLFFASLRADG